MRKAEIVERIADKTGVTQLKAEEVVNTIFDEIKRTLLVITDSVDPVPHRSWSPKPAGFRASCRRNVCH
jgi:hypothetical protein